MEATVKFRGGGGGAGKDDVAPLGLRNRPGEENGEAWKYEADR